MRGIALSQVHRRLLSIQQMPRSFASTRLNIPLLTILTPLSYIKSLARSAFVFAYDIPPSRPKAMQVSVAHNKSVDVDNNTVTL